MYNDLDTRYVVSMNDETTGWETTRRGGVRRTRVAEKMRTPHGTTTKGSTAAAVPTEATRSLVSSTDKHLPDLEKHGGSNPSPRTKQSKWVLALNERLGLPTCPYVIRWRLETPWGSIRLHHWLAPDDGRAKHDHPWSFTTFVLKGGYTDSGQCPTPCDPDCDADCHELHQVSYKREHELSSHQEHLKAWSRTMIRHREATHQHTVFPDEGGCWTIIVTSPKVRQWGFWVNGKFVKMNKYFLKYGHHPCN